MGKGRPPRGGGDLQPVDSIQPTRKLSPREQESWDRWIDVLRKTRQFLPTDGPLLTFVVDLDMRKAYARRALRKYGHYQGARRHPALTDLDNAHRDQMALFREMGLTAASAKNVKTTPRSEETDALAEFMNNETELRVTNGG